MQTVNPAFTQVCGYRIEEILGKNINLLASVKHSKDFYPKLWRYLQQHNPWQGELWHQHKKQGQLLAKNKASTTPFALMFIDLGHFKEVNDSLGHDAGDELLVLAALISPVNPQAQLVAIAENIKTNMTQPFQLSAQTVQISASIGIVLYPDHGQDLFALLKNADIAMYQVKTHSRNDFGFFIPPAATP